MLTWQTHSQNTLVFRLRAKTNTVERRVEALRVFTTLTRVRAGTQFVHGQTDSLVGLLREGTKRHGTCHEMFHDVLHRLHLVDADRILLPTHEVADEDGLLLGIDELRELLELLVVARSGSQLQGRDGLRVPGMLDAVLAPVELT